MRVAILFILAACLGGCFAVPLEINNSPNAVINITVNDADSPDIRPNTKVGALP